MLCKDYGVIVGSAIVKLIEEYGEDAKPHIAEYVERMKNAIFSTRNYGKILG